MLCCYVLNYQKIISCRRPAASPRLGHRLSRLSEDEKRRTWEDGAGDGGGSGLRERGASDVIWPERRGMSNAKPMVSGRFGETPD